MDYGRVVSPIFVSSGQIQSSLLELVEPVISQTSSMSQPLDHYEKSSPPTPDPQLDFIKKENPEDYRFIQQIGSGGYGQVHKAQNVVTGRICAVKVVPLSKKKLQKLLNEPGLQSRMCHKNVANVMGIFCTPTHLNIVQSFYSGGTLRDHIKSAPSYRIEPSLAAWYISQTARGLEYIHNQGIIHRDIKESNILLSSQGVVKIGDFGIAVAKDPLGSNTGYGGTRGWMSPEMIKSLPYTSKTDVWSFGVVCYRLLTGKRPFLANDGSALSERISSGAYPSSRHLEGIAGGLIARFLQVDPARRVELDQVDEIPWIQHHICIAGRRKRPRRVFCHRPIN